MNTLPAPPEFLITYDISDNKKRRSLYLLLCGYGIAIQKSVFLCSLRPTQQSEIKSALNAIDLNEQEAIHCFQINESSALPSPSHIFRLTWILE